MNAQKEAQFIEAYIDWVESWRKKRKRMHRELSPKLKELIEGSELKDLLSKRDLDNDLLMTAYEFRAANKLTDQQKKDYVRKLLKKTKFTIYYPVYHVYNFPDNYQIGFCIAKTFEALPLNVKEEFERHWKEQFKVSTELAGTEDEFLNNRREALVLKVEVEAIGTMKAYQKADEIVDRSLNVLRVALVHDYQAGEHCVTSDGWQQAMMSGYLHGTSHYYPGGTSYQPSLDGRFKELNKIITNPNGDLEEKMRNAVTIIGAATSVRYTTVKFVLLCSALEALVLTKSDRDYLGWRMAERVAFLLGKPSQRENIVKVVNELYNKRSRFVHQDAQGGRRNCGKGLLRIRIDYTLNFLETDRTKESGEILK